MGNEQGKGSSKSVFAQGIRLDLVEASHNLYEFIQLINRHPTLYMIPVIKNAIQRYEQYWLPLASRHFDKTLVAPLDIEWVWYVHMMNPNAYEKDCKHLLGKVIDHKLVSLQERDKLLSWTKELWYQTYPGEIFNADLSDPSPPVDDTFQSELKFDLLQAVLRETIFNYQVSLPHYGDDKFLKEAVKRYYFLISLRKESPSTPFVPYYDNAFVWHAILAHPRLYRRETEKVFGFMLSHDDSAYDRLPGSELWTKIPEARKIWEAKGRSIAVSGGMFRGEPPTPSPVRNPDRYTAYSHKTYYLQPRYITFRNVIPGVYKVIIKCEAKAQNSSATFTVHENMVEAENDLMIDFDFNRDEARFVLNTEHFYGLSVSLYRKIDKVLQEHQIGYNHFPPSPLIGKKIDEVTLPVQLKFAGNIAEDGSLRASHDDKYAQLNGSLNLICRAIQPGTYHFRVEKGNGNFQTHPHIAKLLYHPALVLPYHLKQEDVHCHFAEYQILGSLEDPAFRLRITHCLKPRVSVVEVRNSLGQLVSSGHLVDNGSLPEPSQVSRPPNYCTLTVPQQRAMIIRAQNNDWALLRASWHGYTRYVDPGYLSAELFLLQSSSRVCILIQPTGPRKTVFVVDLNSIGIGRLTIDVEKGIVSFPGQVRCVPEALALASCIAVMFVLCQIRPPPPKDKFDGILRYNSKPKKSYKLDLDDMVFVLNAGLYCMSLPRIYEHF